MRKTRICDSAEMNTGGSACSVDWGKIKGAIIVEHGKKLPADLTPEKLAELCHADRPDRIYPILTFVEYAKSGGEAQVSAVGYGSNQYNGLNAQTDTFTLPRFDEILNAELCCVVLTRNGMCTSGIQTECLSVTMMELIFLPEFRCQQYIQVPHRSAQAVRSQV